MKRSFKRNVVGASMLGYYYYLRGVEKSGKTTLFYEIINELFNGDQTKGLLISCGREDGFKTLPDIQYEIIQDVKDKNGNIVAKIKNSEGKVIKSGYGWEEFVKLIDDLVYGRQENGIEIIGIDTYDELCEMAKNYVIKLHNDANPLKKVTSINSAFGGYNGGFEKLQEAVDEQLYRLRSCGLTPIVISHTKVKTIKEKGMTDDESYNMLTSNLDSRLDNIIAHKADVIATIQIDKDIKDGVLNGTKRYIYFRESNFVKAGSRFKDITEKVELSATNFIKAIEDGIKSSMRKNVSDEEFNKLKEQAEEKRQNDIASNLEKIKEVDSKANEVNIERNKEIQKLIVSKWKDTSKEIKEEIKTIMNKYDIKKIGEVETNLTVGMEEILTKIN
ncbi:MULTISPECIES: AAA family ATPase [unclassified Clostridium]|uniref:AAA family ATPase n=1 Tax=unclassified Clostridium TaxID=2614128 RepID=UPI00207A9000|nr:MULTISPECIES: AAA family ATPase [unclassified Clostridium]